MKTIYTFLAWALLATAPKATAQQWERIMDLPGTAFGAMEVIDGTVYAAAGGLLYFSTDNGQNWNFKIYTMVGVHPNCVFRFQERLFIGTSAGVFSAPADNPMAVWVHELNSPEVVSFTEKNGQLVAATLGSGLRRRMPNGNWTLLINGLPTYSYNVSEVLATPNKLIATAGANGTFYEWNSAQGGWVEKYFVNNTYAPGLDTQDAIYMDGKLYAARHNAIRRSNDEGTTWTLDQNGLVSALERRLAVGQTRIYSVAPFFDPVSEINYTRIDYRNRNAADGSPWTYGETVDLYTYALRENGDKIYLATNDGVYWKTDTSLGIGNPGLGKDVIAVYPNPSPNGNFTLESTGEVDEIAVHDMLGQLIFTRSGIGSLHRFSLPADGIYLVKAKTASGTETLKVVSGN